MIFNGRKQTLKEKHELWQEDGEVRAEVEGNM